MKNRKSRLVLRIEIRTFPYQHVCEVDVTILGSVVEWRETC
jgi:hypothetical protein